ncbi:MAG: hypothetical protein IJ903_03810 [Ruminococcus sp.]|nr:hypothetical protein [Ruminococcus sp.]
MSILKRTTGIVLCLIIALSVVIAPASVSAASAEKKTMVQYNEMNLGFKKAEADNYECVVENNGKGYISVDAKNEGNYYWLMVNSEKVTTKTNKPVLTVYKVDGENKTEYKKYEFTVTAYKKIKMSNVKINKNTWKEVRVKNPSIRGHKLSYNKKIVRFDSYYEGTGGNFDYNVKGLKKGTTKVKVYFKGTKKLIGSFKITVGDFNAKVKKKYKNLTLNYNKHMKKTYYLDGGSVNLGELINNFHANSTYTFKAKNKKLVSSFKVKKTQLVPESVCIYSKKAGNTTLTIYEKRGKAKKKKIDTIKLTVKKVNDAKVFWSNKELDNDGIFYEAFISPGQSFDLKSVVEKRYINLEWTGSKFNKDEYTFTATSNHPEIISVDKDGVCTCNSLDNGGDNEVTYTVTFKDGSKATGSGSFDIWSEEDRPD